MKALLFSLIVSLQFTATIAVSQISHNELRCRDANGRTYITLENECDEGDQALNLGAPKELDRMTTQEFVPVVVGPQSQTKCLNCTALKHVPICDKALNRVATRELNRAASEKSETEICGIESPMRCDNCEVLAQVLTDADPNFQEFDAEVVWTPLYMAYFRNCLVLAKRLLGDGADPNVGGADGDLLATVASWPRHGEDVSVKWVKLLLSHGANSRFPGYPFWGQGLNTLERIENALSKGRGSRRAYELLRAEPAEKSAANIGETRSEKDGLSMDVSDEHRAAVLVMHEDPNKAEGILSQASNLTEKMDYLLFLYSYRSPSQKRDQLIRTLFQEIEAVANSDRAVPSGPSIIPYDGSDDSVVSLIVNATLRRILGKYTYYFPCGVLIKRPELLLALQPIFGGTPDLGLPRSGCYNSRGEIPGFPNTVFEKYIQMSTKFDGDWVNNYRGTAVATHKQYQHFSVAEFRLSPGEFLKSEHLYTREEMNKLEYPYQNWSQLSLHNWFVHQEFRQIYNKTKTAVAKYFRDRKFFDAADSLLAAKQGMFSLIYGANCGAGKPGKMLNPRKTLRQMILNSDDLVEIDKFLKNDDFKKNGALKPLFDCAEFAGIDPLIHIATIYPKALDLLLQWGGKLNVPRSDRCVLDLDLGVNAPNQFGKSPLMTAAQHNLLESAKLLIANGADINAKTDSSYIEPGLKHDQRTPLMYAAASGSLELIRLLLKNGAQRYDRDSKGLTAADYLVGWAPGQNNTRLTKIELDVAKRLILGVR
jgi:hypothetical protein